VRTEYNRQRAVHEPELGCSTAGMSKGTEMSYMNARVRKYRRKSLDGKGRMGSSLTVICLLNRNPKIMENW
jgi:hypothetical protein